AKKDEFEEKTSFVPSPLKSKEKKEAYSSRHPIDRFLSAFSRILSRRGVEEVRGRLSEVHFDVSYNRYKGLVRDYLPKGDPYRRIVYSFLLMPVVMREEILDALSI
ncbi:MAG: hypothetical protein HQK54_18335, partial [Oligoflexales bacterium]|nr:hypothetical protein [Oligoflexales bacterium]